MLTSERNGLFLFLTVCRNFQERKKWLILALVSFVTFLSPLASSIPAPGIELMDEQFGVTSTILSALAVSIFVLGFAVGPLIMSPLSETYGRQIVLNVSNFLLSIWQIGCALSPNMASLIVFRFLAGLGGSACLAVGGGIIADLFPLQQRGQANALFTTGPLFGPVIGPIIGGFIAQRAGWRWVYWFLLIACGLVTVVNWTIGQETNPKVLIQRKTEKLQEELQRTDLQSVYTAKNPLSPYTLLIQSVTRPIRILFDSVILLLLALFSQELYTSPLTEKLPIGKGFSALADLLASIAASVITSSHEVLTTEDFNTAGDPLTSDAKRLPVLQTSDAGYTTAPLRDQAFVDNQLPSIETASTVFDFLFQSLSPFDVEM
ncbi:MFS general substrate transporter [Penicillium longicatenatum]|nr:MFS general substrate transporter [Penicillium longicatenatum]